MAKVKREWRDKAKYHPTSGKKTIERIYYVEEATEADDAITALMGVVPPNIGDCVIGEISLTAEADGKWRAVVPYSMLDNNAQTGSKKFSFDTSGGSIHISTSLETLDSFARSGETAPETNNLIGLQQDGSAEGVQIIEGLFKFSMTRYMSWATADQTYLDLLKNCTGRTNSETFTVQVRPERSYSFSTGEVLFMGANGSERKEYNDLEIECTFLVASNQSGLTIGDITGINKPGHALLWVYMEGGQVDATGPIIKRPKYVKIERVYFEADLNGIV